MRRDSEGVLLIEGDVSQTIIEEAGPQTDPTVTRETPMDLPSPRPLLADFDPGQFVRTPQGMALVVVLAVFGLLLLVAAVSLLRRRRPSCWRRTCRPIRRRRANRERGG
jgi:hypothetical protein